MAFFQSLFGRREVRWRAALGHIQTKFSVFRSLLDQQNQVLKAISSLEETSRRNLPPDAGVLDEIRTGIAALVEKMIELGGDDYGVLRQRYQAIGEYLEDDLAARGKGDRHLLSEQPSGCFAQKVPVTFSAGRERLLISRAAEVLQLACKGRRSEERRVGKECRRLCRSRWSPYH
jgi:hypothetical protein